MTWEEIAGLHEMDRDRQPHRQARECGRADPGGRTADLELIERRCREHGLPTPVRFAYPGNGIGGIVVQVLKEKGYLFARRGGAPEFPYEGGQGIAFDPKKHEFLSIPSAGDARPAWKLEPSMAGSLLQHRQRRRNLKVDDREDLVLDLQKARGGPWGKLGLEDGRGMSIDRRAPGLELQ